jgi:YVTN family beta-propeller protein/VCBS repeat-containing protein
MEYSRYVGRIGALAVALGVGVAIAAPAGVAWAEPEDSSAPVSSSTDTGAADTAAGSTPTGSEQVASGVPEASGAADPTSASQNEQSPEQVVDQSPSSSTVEVAPGVTVSSSGGSHKSPDTKKGAKYATRSRAGKEAAAPTTHVTSQTNAESGVDVETQTAATAETATPVAATEAAAVIVPMGLNVEQPRVTKPVVSPATVFLRNVVRPILSSIMGAIPNLPTESPVAWVFLAAARRQIGVSEPEIAQVTTLAVTTALVVENQAPTIGAPVIDTPVAVTGVVTGQVVATDPEGQPLTYTLTTPPPAGKVVFDTATAKFTYTPTTSQRIGAGVTSGVDTVAMTVTVSDGTTSVPTVINIPVSPTYMTESGEIAAVNDAHAVVVTATRAYVTNRSAGTVTVIDTTTNSVIGTIAVGPTPDALAIKPDGTRLYVTSLENNTVKVVDTSTKTVIATIATTTPSAVAINSSGSTLYVTSLDTGKVVTISTSTNTVTGVVTLPTGSRPTGILVSPDKTKIYVISNKATGGGTVAVFGYTSTTVTTIANLSSTPTGLAVSPDNKRLYVSSADGKITVVDTTTRAVLATHTVAGVPAGVTVSKDGSTLLVTNTAGRVSAIDAATGSLLSTFATRTSTSAMSVAPGQALSPDGKQLYVTDYDADKMYVVSLIPPNNAPTAGTPTFNAPNATTGAVTGKVGVIDIDRDVLTYTVTGKPAKGTLALKADGTFTYTPTATARHAASAVNAPLSAKTDSFVVSVSDGRGGVVTATVTVNILPANKVPTYTLTVGTPSSTTGVVTGKVTASDADYDVRTFTAGTPAKGTVVVTSTGSFTYTPTAAARHAAAKLDATTADKQDTFTITINDGHGGVVPVSVTVQISPTNSAPTGAAVGNTSINLHTGAVTGTVTATDANNDPLSFSSTAPTKGVLVFGSNGTFTYTPTEAARLAAAAPNATAATKTDAVTITVSDGYGGTTSVTVSLPVTAYGNTAPTNGHATVGDPTTAIGEVRGTLTADDAENDTLTYVLTTGPTKGVVNIDSSGAFRYVPDVEARWGAKATPGVDTDSFVVTVSDGNNGTQTFTVSVTIAPPATSTIDQRGTTVAMNVQELYFANQADTDRALDLLKADGVNTIRIMIPWAGVEATDDVWTWSAIDRVVNAAVARDMEVQAFLNSPPAWAVVPGTPALGGPPADPQEYAEFVSMVATRYAGKISAYEVWNEPNYYKFWEPAPDAAAYTELLKAAYTAIKAADPNAVVIGGVIAAAPDSGTQFVNSVRFVTEMYEAGAAGYFDALSFHPYHYYLKFSQGEPYPTSPLTLVNQIHDVMVAYGDGNKKIWATEYGEPSSLAGEAGQAAFIDDFLSTWRDLDYAGPAFIHDVHDYFTLDPIAASFGIYRLNWTPKPAADVIEAIIDENEAYLAGGGGIEL